MENPSTNKSSPVDLIDKTIKLDSLLVLISQAIIDGNVGNEEIVKCVGVAWDINYEIKSTVIKMYGGEHD
ncbi:hypothetical protein [Rahnella sp. ChDrAdgB13]|uniref:hypothetical protein n=1 Tax=Rahnella sp. ChDrAdgB13 TaxID=1850581 RepID=UPI001AD85081|nr:hypothetical protein [Rahnella sp. ChDrAdgB13]